MNSRTEFGISPMKKLFFVIFFIWGVSSAADGYAQTPRELMDEANLILNDASEDQERQKAVDLLLQAVDANNLPALFTLGKYYVEGEVLDQDIDRGLAMIFEASALGFAQAGFYLFDYFVNEEEFDKAISVLQRHVEAENPRAALSLARFFATGPENMRDLGLAQIYLDRAEQILESRSEPLDATEPVRIGIIRSKLSAGGDSSQIQQMLLELDKLASANNVDALALLANAYLGGLYGVDEDAAKGTGYLAKAAALEHTPSIYRLGRAYLQGTGVEVDVIRAVSLLEESAKDNFQPGVVFLSSLVISGEYSGYSIDQAVAILEEAAEAGNGFAAATLARHLSGTGMGSADLTKAVDVARQAAQSGSSPAQLLLADLLLKKNSQKDTEEAIEIYKSVANEGSVAAASALVHLYLKGEKASKNKTEAEKYINLLEEINSGPAKLFLSRLYRNGELIEPNQTLGIRYLTEAYESGLDAAVVPFARTLLDGDTGQKDTENALAILEKATVEGNTAAARALGLLYWSGDSELQNKAKAIEILEPLVERTDTAAVPFLVGNAYLRGDGVATDIERASRYLEIANMREHPAAPFILGREYLSGRLLPRNYRLAAEYLETAVDRGNDRALIFLGDVFWRNRNTSAAISSYQSAADRGIDLGKVKIGQSYLNSARFPGRQTEGLDILEDLSDSGVPEASLALAAAYRFGQFKLPVDQARALSYYDAAIANGNEPAQGLRLALLAEINPAPSDFAAIRELFQDLSPSGRRTFILSGFAKSDKQIAYIVQEKLRELGYYGGPLDGLFGPGSQAAMQLFCRDDAFNGPCATPVWSRENAFRVLNDEVG